MLAALRANWDMWDSARAEFNTPRSNWGAMPSTKMTTSASSYFHRLPKLLVNHWRAPLCNSAIVWTPRAKPIRAGEAGIIIHKSNHGGFCLFQGERKWYSVAKSEQIFLWFSFSNFKTLLIKALFWSRLIEENWYGTAMNWYFWEPRWFG